MHPTTSEHPPCYFLSMTPMESELDSIRSHGLTEIQNAQSATDLDALKVKFLGRNGSLVKISEKMRDVPKEDKPKVGKLLHEVRNAIQSAIQEKTDALTREADMQALAGLDVSLPSTPLPQGGIHPISLLLDRTIQIMRRMGFVLADGPDIETEWHCFDALNTPQDHPARNEQDTFYLHDGRLLRTQTSTVQVRVMESTPPPIRIIAPGACYRRDETDATHLSQFNQIEGLYVAENVSLADLKATATRFIHELFGPDTEVRFRPHFFPFTEPSYEIDVKLKAIGKWLELAGCGMVDPAVFEAINKSRGDNAYDPEVVSGFAFGFGLDRLAMILTQLPDIRLLIENDLKFLSQFSS